MLQVQTTKVALQEEEHLVSLSTIKNCLVQLDDLSHFFSYIIELKMSHALTLPQTHLPGFLPVPCLSAYFLQVFICSPIVNCSSDTVAEHEHPRAVFSRCFWLCWIQGSPRFSPKILLQLLLKIILPIQWLLLLGV